MDSPGGSADADSVRFDPDVERPIRLHAYIEYIVTTYKHLITRAIVKRKA